ncbi:MAG: glycosyltransferase family 39 protein [Patescibacteria group bacterium]|nr:glycosyltransferase family 39 protein [Patescibacteria group bacterium]
MGNNFLNLSKFFNGVRDLFVNEKKEFIVIRIFWLIIIIYPFLFLWHGLNFSDEGNIMTIYRLIFSDPYSIRTSIAFGTWGASIIGGSWLSIFGGFGLIGVRFAGALVSILTVIVSYFILKEYIKKKILLLGFLISFLFSYHFFTLTIIGYSNLSILFFAISILFLTKGLKKNNNALVFLAGFFLVFNIFIRLPNILGLFFILAIPYNACIKNIRAKEYLRHYFAFITGALISFAVVYFIMRIFGHVNYYIESLKYLMESTQNNNGPYNAQGLIFSTFKGYFSLFGNFILMFLLAILGFFLYLKFKLNRLNFFIKLFLLLLFLLFLYVEYNFIGILIGGRVVSLLTGLCYAVLFAHVLNYKEGDKNLNLIALLMLILFIIIPLGSGAGHINALYLIPISFPIVVNYIHNIKKIDFSLKISQLKYLKDISFVINEKIIKSGKYFILAVFIPYALTNAFAFSYDDSYNRFLLNTKINSNYLKGIYTTEEKAIPLNELLLQLPKYIQKNDTILVTWIAPIIYYITETKPYFPSPWTEIYDRDQITAFLNNNFMNKKLPVVIRYDYLSKHRYDDILYNFFKKNSYEKKWNNKMYEIYIPAIHQ